jgi:hypothetical protein
MEVFNIVVARESNYNLTKGEFYVVRDIERRSSSDLVSIKNDKNQVEQYDSEWFDLFKK